MTQSMKKWEIFNSFNFSRYTISLILLISRLETSLLHFQNPCQKIPLPLSPTHRIPNPTATWNTPQPSLPFSSSIVLTPAVASRETATVRKRKSDRRCLARSSFGISFTFCFSFFSFFFKSCCSSRIKYGFQVQSGACWAGIPTAGEGRVKSTLGGGTFGKIRECVQYFYCQRRKRLIQKISKSYSVRRNLKVWLLKWKL